MEINIVRCWHMYVTASAAAATSIKTKSIDYHSFFRFVLYKMCCCYYYELDLLYFSARARSSVWVCDKNECNYIYNEWHWKSCRSSAINAQTLSALFWKWRNKQALRIRFWCWIQKRGQDYSFCKRFMLHSFFAYLPPSGHGLCHFIGIHFDFKTMRSKKK